MSLSRVEVGVSPSLVERIACAFVMHEPLHLEFSRAEDNQRARDQYLMKIEEGQLVYPEYRLEPLGHEVAVIEVWLAMRWSAKRPVSVNRGDYVLSAAFVRSVTAGEVVDQQLAAILQIGQNRRSPWNPVQPCRSVGVDDVLVIRSGPAQRGAAYVVRPQGFDAICGSL